MGCPLVTALQRVCTTHLQTYRISCTYVRTYVCMHIHALCMCTGILYADNCMYVQTLYVCSRGSDSVAIMQCLFEKEWQNGVEQRMHADTYAHHKINSHSLKAYTEVPRHVCLNGMCVCVCVRTCVCTYVRMCMCVWLHPKR